MKPKRQDATKWWRAAIPKNNSTAPALPHASLFARTAGWIVFLLLLVPGGLLSAQTPFTPPETVTGAHTITVQPLNVPPELGMRELPDEDVKYYGVLQNQDQLDALWELQENVMDDLPPLLSWMIPDPIQVDFPHHTVLWYSNRGARASFVELKNVTESEHALTVHIEVTHSDFGSARLNLWRILKTDKPVMFKEIHFYNQGP